MSMVYFVKCEKVAQGNVTEELGDTPLMKAVQSRDLTVVENLMRKEVNPNACTKNGSSPLDRAATSGRPEIMTLLLEKGANVNAVDKFGESALFHVAAQNLTQTARVLLKRGANVNLTSKTGISPLLTAAYNGHDAMVLLLLQHGAQVDLSTIQFDNTPLFWAVQKCSYATAKALLDAGANPFHKTQCNVTVLQKAKDKLMGRLIGEYQQVGGPSWLMRELSARGLEWAAICDVQDRFSKDGVVSREDFLSVMSSTYPWSLGVPSLHVRQVLVQLRLQSTWLGARLTQSGLHSECIEVCEIVVVQRYGCASEASFARVLPEELSDESLARLVSMAAPVRRCLREVHAQVCAEQAALKTPVLETVKAVETPAAPAVVPAPAVPEAAELSLHAGTNAEEAEKGNWDTCE